MRHSSCRARAAHWVTLLTAISLSFTTVPAAADYEDGVNAAFAGDLTLPFASSVWPPAGPGPGAVQSGHSVLYRTRR